MSKIPKQFLRFTREFKVVADAYESLGNAVHAAGPLIARERALVKLGISIGARLEGAVHSHARKALSAGLQKNVLQHAALLALPTIGLPSMMAALSWIDDVAVAGRRKRK